MSGLLILAQYHMSDGDHMDGWGWAMGALMIVVTVAVIVLVIWIVRTLGPHAPDGAAARDSAKDVLDRRLASGELSPEEYRERAALLRGE